MSRFGALLGLIGLTLLPSWLALAAPASERADIHLHYKWNQRELTSPEAALEALRENRVRLAGVIGTPPELARELQRTDPDRVFAWYGPYSTPADWSRWYFDEDLPERAEAALASGDYRGIGELHLLGGFAPSWDTPVLSRLLELSERFRAPLMLHVEFGRADYLLGLCKQRPEARLLLAHAGAPMPAREVRRAQEACPNLWWELSARDPWRYTGTPILDEQGHLKPEWKQLVLDFSERLMLGSDPVWPVDQLDRWDEADSGWQHIGRFWDAHEVWLEELPEPVAARIRLENALEYFARD